jgi:hypothetical protein
MTGLFSGAALWSGYDGTPVGEVVALWHVAHMVFMDRRVEPRERVRAQMWRDAAAVRLCDAGVVSLPPDTVRSMRWAVEAEGFLLA